MRQTDSYVGHALEHAGAGSKADQVPFTLQGGRYAVTVASVGAAWGGGSVALQRLAADGITYVSVHAAWTADAYIGTLDLPFGKYEILIATATAIEVDIVRVPGE